MSAEVPGGGGRYALITAAYDEEASIGATIESVLAQTQPPARWVVASDGSTDRTDEIVREHARASGGRLVLVRREERAGHDFGSKVRALRLAEEALADLDYDFLGVLDADVRPAPDYFARVLAHFASEPRLGIGGGSIVQLVGGRRVGRLKDPRTVAGAVQFFRRRCFEETGGFLPLPYGGEDAVIEVLARMRGWQVRTFPELEVLHDGLVGGDAGRLRARRRWGRMNRSIGYHPLYQLARAARRLIEPPPVAGALAELWGYASELLRPGPRLVPDEVVRHLRREQLRALARLLGRRGR